MNLEFLNLKLSKLEIIVRDIFDMRFYVSYKPNYQNR